MMQSPDTKDDTAWPRRPSLSCTNLAGGVTSEYVHNGQAWS